MLLERRLDSMLQNKLLNITTGLTLSTRRKGQSSEYTFFCYSVTRHIQHINVCWLSLQKAVNRKLLMDFVTNLYILSENCSEACFKHLKSSYESEIYLLLLQVCPGHDVKLPSPWMGRLQWFECSRELQHKGCGEP